MSSLIRTKANKSERRKSIKNHRKAERRVRRVLLRISINQRTKFICRRLLSGTIELRFE